MTEIEEAEKRCREAWTAAPDAKWAWCCHHEIRLEPLSEPAENRIDYIVRHKAKAEQVTRLNNFRPVLSPLPTRLVEAWKAYAGKAYVEAGKAFEAGKAYVEARKACTTELNTLHAKDVPNHTWNGESIFKTL